MLPRLQAKLLRCRRWLSRSEWVIRRLRLPVSAEPAHAPGLVLLQIDGLAYAQLERALARGRMPFLQKLLRHRGYQLNAFYSGLPSSTPAVQGELYYGVKSAVPAFSFLERASGRIALMMMPEWAKQVEAELATQGEGLLRGGSSWSNIYTGGATQREAHFCGASIGLTDMWRTGKLRTLAAYAFLHTVSLFRLLALLPLELVLAVTDAVRGTLAKPASWRRELLFIVARVFVCVGLREVVTRGAAIDAARGLPVIHVNFLGYDEQSHRRGPDSAFAHWTLRGIDRAIREIWKAAHRSGRRDYEVWIISDHGQTRSQPFALTVPGGLEGLVRRLTAELGIVAPPTGTRPIAPLPATRTSASPRPPRAPWIGGLRTGRYVAEADPAASQQALADEGFVVAAMGPVGHLYFAEKLAPPQQRRLAAALVREGVPGVLLPRDDGRVDWLTAQGEFLLPDHADALPHPDPAWRREIAADLAGLAQQPNAGDIVTLAWSPKGTRYSFAFENGAHAGPSPEETKAFALLPAGVIQSADTTVLRPAVLRALALQHLGRAPGRGQRRGSTRSEPRPLHVPLRVATYNVHACLGADGRVSPARIARVLDRLDADIVALQELDLGRSRSRNEDQLRLIAEELGLHAVFCPAWQDARGSYGHALLSRTPLELIRNTTLPGPPRLAEPRAALWTRTTIAGAPVHMVSAHLGLLPAEQAAQIAALLGDEWLGAIPPEEPVILCGDFNIAAGSRLYRRLAERLRDVQAHAPRHVAQRTFPAVWPLRRIDHVFVSPTFGITAVRVPRDALLHVASDHLPVIADLTVPAPAPVVPELTLRPPPAPADSVTAGK